MLLRGAEGATEAGLAEDDDFDWSLSEDETQASAGSGRVFSVTGTHFPLEKEDITDADWTLFHSEFLRSMAHQPGITVHSGSTDQQFNGARWMVYRLSMGDGGEPQRPVDYIMAVTLQPGWVYMLGVFCYAAPEGALDSGLRLALEGPVDPAADTAVQ